MEKRLNPVGTTESISTPLGRQYTFSIVAQSRAIKFLLPGMVVLWCTAAWILSGLYADQREAQVIARRYESAQVSAKSIRQNVEQELAIVRNVPVILSEDPQIISLLVERFGALVKPSELPMAERNASWRADSAFHGIALRLQTIVDKIGLSSLFVMNAAGDCIAEGHEANNKDFTGANYFDREYFQQARSGKIGQQFAVGRVTDFLALFYASPIEAEDKFIGAIGSRINLSNLFTSSPEHDFFVTDDNGVIILAKDIDLRMKALPNAKVFSLSDHDRETRYKQKNFEKIAFDPSSGADKVGLLQRKGRPQPYVIAHQSVSDDLVTVYVLRDLEDVVVMRSESRWWFALTSILGSLMMLLIAGGMLLIKVERAYRQQLLSLNESLALQARTDPLTGCANRRRFLESLTSERQRWDRYEVPFSILSLDLDHFKKINDSFGHSAGDLVLQKFVEIVQSLLRPSDLLGRMGGEEFSVLMPHTRLAEAMIIGERIRAAIAATPFKLGGVNLNVTVSIGVSEWDGVDGETVEDFLNRSDKALYAAKEAGRNTVCAEISNANNN